MPLDFPHLLLVDTFPAIQNIIPPALYPAIQTLQTKIVTLSKLSALCICVCL